MDDRLLSCVLFLIATTVPRTELRADAIGSLPGECLSMIESIVSMTRRAAEGGRAIGYVESWLQGVVHAAEQTRPPVAIGVSADFLFRKHRRTEERVNRYGALGRAAAEAVGDPCCIILDRCPHDGVAVEAVHSGANAVMPIAGDLERTIGLGVVKVTHAKYVKRREPTPPAGIRLGRRPAAGQPPRRP